MISVSENNRRRKIGSNLLKNLLKKLILQNIKQVELEVRTDNFAAISFYKKNGFFIKEMISNFYQNGEDAYNMRLLL